MVSASHLISLGIFSCTEYSHVFSENLKFPKQFHRQTLTHQQNSVWCPHLWTTPWLSPPTLEQFGVAFFVCCWCFYPFTLFSHLYNQWTPRRPKQLLKMLNMLKIRVSSKCFWPVLKKKSIIYLILNNEHQLLYFLHAKDRSCPCYIIFKHLKSKGGNNSNLNLKRKKKTKQLWREVFYLK